MAVTMDMKDRADLEWARLTTAVDSARRLLLHNYEDEFEGEWGRLEGLVWW